MERIITPVLNDLRNHLDKLYGERLIKLMLFGSQARSDADAGSDIDILVVLKEPVNPGDEITQACPVTAALSLKYDVVISCVFVSEGHFKTKQSPLLINIRSEGVLV